MTLLHLDSSIQGDRSASRAMSAAVVDTLRAADPAAQIVYRDLAADPVPHLSPDVLADPLANRELQGFLAADTIVIGAGLYNFGIPSQLKSWIDRILVAGQTFRYTPEGPVGLAGGKRVIVAVSRGGFYDQGNSLEHVEAYLKPLFNFLGIQPEFVFADGIGVSTEQRDSAIANSLAEIERLAA